jgi:hypothetical protein
MTKPTPEEKCSMEPSIEEMSSEEFIGHLFYNVLGGLHANEEIDARRGILDMIADKSSPSPEARCKGCGTVGCTMHNDEPEARVADKKETCVLWAFVGEQGHIAYYDNVPCLYKTRKRAWESAGFPLKDEIKKVRVTMEVL